MHDAADAVRRPIPLDEREGVVPGFARMNDDRLPSLGRHLQLFNEGLLLYFARGKIVMVIETDFADSQHLWVREKISEMFEIVRARFRGVVRMNANGCVEGRVF